MSRSGRSWRSRLWHKYLLLLGALLAGALGSIGLAEMLFASRDAERLVRLEQARAAQEVAGAIEVALGSVQRQIDAVLRLPWEQSDWLDLNRRRQEYRRLLLVEEMLGELQLSDESGATVLSVSRRDPDRVAPGGRTDAPAPPAQTAQDRLPLYGPVFYRDGYEPYVTLTPRGPQRPGETTSATLSLRVLAEQLQPLLDSPGRRIYAVDADHTVVLHADIAEMLRRARREPASRQRFTVQVQTGLDGSEVIATTRTLEPLGWTVVVEQPLDEALAAVRRSLLRIAAVTAAAMLLAGLASVWMARRMARPIAALSDGASRLAGGDLGVRIGVHTRDELEDLAHQFNRMAQALQDNVLQLEQRVADKTRDLAVANADLELVNTELQRANFALRLASQHKSEFLAHMSHELRTPLNAILGFADVLREGMAGPMNEAQREFAGDIHASGLHLLELINDVLDLAKIEAGQVVLQPSPFVVREVLDAAVAMVRQRCLRAGLTLEVAVAPEVGTWVADPRRFKQVLLNLLFNAVKFTPAGGVRVCVAVEPGQGLVVLVQDSGLGIDPAEHERIFEPFYQAAREAAAGDTALQGTGLGLPLARQLVRQHGGEIAVFSRRGAGASFVFHLPGSPS
jgi:signal transduction histidine kinase